MDAIKTITKVLLKLILFLLIIFINISFVIQNIVVNTFSQEILSKKVSGYVLDNIFKEFKLEELENIENNIRKDKQTKIITSKFIKTVSQNIINNEEKDLNIEREIDKLIEKNIAQNVQNEKIKEIKQYTITNLNLSKKNLETTLSDGFGSDYIVILKIYNIITNVSFKIIIMFLIFINVLILYLIEKIKLLKTIKIITLIISILMLTGFICIKLLFNYIDQILAGGWLQNINANTLLISFISNFVISFVLVILNKKIKK